MSSVSSLKDERAIIFPFLSSTRLLLSLSLCGFSRGRKMKFSREEAGEKVGSRRTRATIN